MMAHLKLWFLLLLVFAARTGLNLKLYRAESVSGCPNSALSEAKKGSGEENSLLEKRSFKFWPGEDASSEDNEEDAEEDEKEKRTFPAVTRYKYLAQAQGKGKVYQVPARGGRRTMVTLSLDVPTHIMNILFDIAKARDLRAKAAANAQIMAQIGRRK